MKLTPLSQDVFLAPGPIATIGRDEIDFLRQLVRNSARGRVRICAHQDNSDGLHEMFIAIRPDSYIRPHKHPGKSEAFHVVHGSVDIVVFDDTGGLDRVISLSADQPDLPFYYRMSKPFFHTLIIKSELLVVHEITEGPFIAGQTVFASFAPGEEASSEGVRFMAALKKDVAHWAERGQ